MSDVNLQLVREFFELNLFHVLTHWQHDPAYLNAPESGLQLFVENLNAPPPPSDLDFVLRAEDVSAIQRALVEVRAWHADRFYPSVIESNPVLAQLVGEDSLAFARQIFGTSQFTTVLVISELPVSHKPRQRSIELLHRVGIGHVLEYPTVLRDVVDKISANGAYASQTLQTLRLLKRYRLIQRQQLELRFPTEPPVAVPAPTVETAQPPQDDED